jgi:hypothetical protein
MVHNSHLLAINHSHLLLLLGHVDVLLQNRFFLLLFVS